ncbi:hypothetical protein [Botryobacter ruber]|uniref:hypothetical protein n=1 Tax=Botryobacter ruber TaxID=2171629 RepID=UPI000F6548AF|nr:hypothetical protein [Botryobacter ruber]
MKACTITDLMLPIFALLSFVLFSYTLPSAGWFIVKVDSSIAVQFPVQPDTSVINGVQVYKAQTEDALYMALVIDQPLRPDQDHIENAQEFYKGFIRSFVNNAKGTFVDSASFTLEGFKGINFSYTVPQGDGSSVKRTNRTILTKDKLCSLTHTPLAQPTETSEEAKFYFLESIEILK